MKTDNLEYKYEFLLRALKQFIEEGEIRNDDLILTAFGHVCELGTPTEQETELLKIIVEHANKEPEYPFG